MYSVGKLLVGILLVFMISPALSEEQVQITLEQLDSLAAQKDWSNLVVKLSELKPLERNAHWESLVEQAAVEYLKEVAGRNPVEVEGAARGLAMTYPKLAISAKLRRTRDELLLHLYAACYTQGANAKACTDRLKAYAARYLGDRELVVEAVRLISEKDRPSAALSLLISAIHEPGGAGLCQSPITQRVLREAGAGDCRLLRAAASK